MPPDVYGEPVQGCVEAIQLKPFGTQFDDTRWQYNRHTLANESPTRLARTVANKGDNETDSGNAAHPHI